MVTRDLVERWLREAFLSQYVWLAQHIADVTNLLAKTAHLPSSVESAVKGAIGAMKECARRPHAADVKRLLVEHLNDTAMAWDRPAELDRLQPPEPPVGWNPDEKSLEERDFKQLKIRQDVLKLNLHRSRATGERGQLLVAAAVTLLGKYRWVPAGLDPSRSFFPSERSNEPTANDFARWINRHEPLPDNARLNCWEAVFVCATTAGLLSEAQLRMDYVASAVVAVRATQPRSTDQKQREDALTDDYLLRVLMKFDDSVPIEPGTELMPSPGDLIFLERDHHVVICSKVDAHKGFDGIEVISHWSHPSHGIQRLPLDSWGTVLLGNVRFTPCPF
jgi:hypothetical protein